MVTEVPKSFELMTEGFLHKRGTDLRQGFRRKGVGRDACQEDMSSNNWYECNIDCFYWETRVLISHRGTKWLNHGRNEVVRAIWRKALEITALKGLQYFLSPMDLLRRRLDSPIYPGMENLFGLNRFRCWFGRRTNAVFHRPFIWRNSYLDLERFNLFASHRSEMVEFRKRGGFGSSGLVCAGGLRLNCLSFELN